MVFEMKTSKLVVDSDNVNFTALSDIQFEEENAGKKKKEPRRIIHFSDGVLEEYSTDEEGEDVPDVAIVDTRTLNWPKWFFHQMWVSAVKTLGAIDNCGEKLAWFFGITSPKYQFYIDAAKRMAEEEELEKQREEREKQAELRRTYDSLEAADTGIENKSFSSEVE